MKRHVKAPVAIATVLLLVASTCATAAVDLRFAPADTTVDVATSGTLRIMLDEALTVRTLDVSVAYDTTVVRTAGWSAGAIFTEPGFFLFKGLEEPTPGHWHAYVIVMGSQDYAMGPGELFRWNFDGIADGITDIETVPWHPDSAAVYLSNVEGVYYDDVALGATTITVGDGIGAVLPPARGPELRLWPNPFNPTVVLCGEVDFAGLVDLTVYDAAGRRVRSLVHEVREAGPASWFWNGRDDTGRAAPSGAYLFRLRTGAGATSARGVLLK